MSDRRKFLVIFGLAVAAWGFVTAGFLLLLQVLTIDDIHNALMEMFS
jgi:hypothetical protein